MPNFDAGSFCRYGASSSWSQVSVLIKCRWWQVTPKHAYSLDSTKSEWADYADVQTWCGNLSGNELTRNPSGNSRSQSSQLAEPLWTDPRVKSEISVRELIST